MVEVYMLLFEMVEEYVLDGMRYNHASPIKTLMISFATVRIMLVKDGGIKFALCTQEFYTIPMLRPYQSIKAIPGRIRKW